MQMHADSTSAAPSPSPSPPPAAAPSSSHSLALARAVQFVSAYYKVLAQHTDELYTFYDDDSCCVRIAEEQHGAIVDHEQHTGQLAIHNLHLALGYGSCKVKVESLDAMESVNDSLIVLVTGIIVLQTQKPKSFVQHFLLVQAAAEGAGDEPTRYYIRNDIQRYLEPIHTPPPANAASAAAAVHSNSNSTGNTLHPPKSPQVKIEPTTPHAAAAPDDAAVVLPAPVSPALQSKATPRKSGPPGFEAKEKEEVNGVADGECGGG